MVRTLERFALALFRKPQGAPARGIRCISSRIESRCTTSQSVSCGGLKHADRVEDLAVAALSIALAGMILVAVARPRIVRGLEGLIGGHAARMQPSTADPVGGHPGVTETRAATLQGFTYPLFTAVGFETAGFGTANGFTGQIEDRGSIEQVCGAIDTPAQRGIAACSEELRSMSRVGPAQASGRFGLKAV